MPLPSIVNHFSKDCNVNNALVNAFIERRYDVNLNVSVTEFMASQIARVIYNKDREW